MPSTFYKRRNVVLLKKGEDIYKVCFETTKNGRVIVTRKQKCE